MKKTNDENYSQQSLYNVNFIYSMSSKINSLSLMISPRNKKTKLLTISIRFKILIYSFLGILSLNGCTPTFSQQGEINTSFISLEVKRKFLIHEQYYPENASVAEKPSVMVSYVSDSGRAYPWLYLRPLGVDFPNDKRALEVANRLEKYRLEKLKILAWGTTNGQEIICAYTEQKPNDCQIVVTVAPGIDPKKVLILLQCKMKSIEEGSPLCPGPVES